MDWGAIFGAISSAIQSVLSYIWFLVQEIYAFIIYVGNFIWDALVAFAKASWGVFGHVYNFLKHVWDKVIKAPITAIWSKIKALHEALKKLLDPLVKYIRKVRDYLDKIFNEHIKPILNLLQRIRAVLAVFRLFHFKFAQKLDAQILKIEGKIAQTFLEVRGWLTYALDWIDIIIEPGKFFHEGMLLASVLRDIGTIWDAIRGLYSSAEDIANAAKGDQLNKILTPDGQRSEAHKALSGEKTDSQVFMAEQKSAYAANGGGS